MGHELEIVSHSRMGYLNIFVVHLMARTPHIHKDCEVGLILRGFLSLRVGGNTRRLGQGDIYLVNSLEAHEFVSDEGALILAIQISADFLDSFIPDSTGMRFTGSPVLTEQLAVDPECLVFLRALCVEMAYHYLDDPAGRAYKCFSLAATLITCLRERLPSEQLSRYEMLPIKKRSERLMSILDYIDANFTRKLLLEEIAEREGLTLYYLSHLFKSTLGISFQNYLKQKRFEYACRLIVTTDLNILDVSIESGFSDVRYLNSMFKETYSCSTAEYRLSAAAAQAKSVILSDSDQSFLQTEDALRLLAPFRESYMAALGDIRVASFLF